MGEPTDDQLRDIARVASNSGYYSGGVRSLRAVWDAAKKAHDAQVASERRHLLETLQPDDSPSPYKWYGLCECHDPDEEGWGRADVYGDTPQDVVDMHWEHVADVERDEQGS